GPGGQNVNKVSSKVELRFSVKYSSLLTEDEKFIVNEKLKNKINNEGELIIVSQSSRSQLTNKENCIQIFYELLKFAFQERKKRKASRISYAEKARRHVSKKIHSQKKAIRRNRSPFED